MACSAFKMIGTIFVQMAKQFPWIGLKISLNFLVASRNTRRLVGPHTMQSPVVVSKNPFTKRFHLRDKRHQCPIIVKSSPNAIEKFAVHSERKTLSLLPSAITSESTRHLDYSLRFVFRNLLVETLHRVAV